MTENQGRNEPFSPYARDLESSFGRFLSKSAPGLLNFGTLTVSNLPDFKHAVGKAEWKSVLSELSEQDRVKLFDASVWAANKIDLDRTYQLKRKTNLNNTIEFLQRALTESYDLPIYRYLSDNSPVRTGLLVTPHPNVAKEYADKLGIPYTVIHNRPFEHREAQVYAHAARDVRKLSSENQNDYQNESHTETMANKLRTSYLHLMNHVTDVKLGDLLDPLTSFSGLVYSESDIKRNIKRLSIAKQVELFDATGWAYRELRYSSKAEKPVLLEFITMLRVKTEDFFDPIQKVSLHANSDARISLLESSNEADRRKYCVKLGLAYEHMSWSTFDTIEARIYTEAEQVMLNLERDRKKEEESRNKNQGSGQQYQRGPQYNERSQSRRSENLSLSDLIKNIPPLDPEVYKTYRGGDFDMGRDRIQDFDRAVIQLLKTGKLVFDTRDRQTITPSSDANREDFIALKQLIDTWGQGNAKTSETFAKEVACSAERIYLHHELRNKLDDTDPKYEKTEDLAKYFGAVTPGILKNPGVVMGLGLILTNNTRRFVDQKPSNGENEKKRSYIKNKHRELARSYHPDVLKSLPPIIAEQFKAKFREINNAYSVLESDDSFRRYSIL